MNLLTNFILPTSTKPPRAGGFGPSAGAEAQHGIKLIMGVMLTKISNPNTSTKSQERELLLSRGFSAGSSLRDGWCTRQNKIILSKSLSHNERQMQLKNVSNLILNWFLFRIYIKKIRRKRAEAGI